AEVFAEKRREFEQRVSQVQRLVQQRKGELDRIQGDSMRQVQVALNKIISEIAIEKGYILILRRNMTVLASNNLDITDRVLGTLNKSLASVKVAEPAK
ncbi:MAG TPA: OmpH family outer membrane protein, partial [Rhodospirillales bacterium]|nr:OmpH family outer membrane protein [Rhodospirillales bacterium]